MFYSPFVNYGFFVFLISLVIYSSKTIGNLIHPASKTRGERSTIFEMESKTSFSTFKEERPKNGLDPSANTHITKNKAAMQTFEMGGETHDGIGYVDLNLDYYPSYSQSTMESKSFEAQVPSIGKREPSLDHLIKIKKEQIEGINFLKYNRLFIFILFYARFFALII